MNHFLRVAGQIVHSPGKGVLVDLTAFLHIVRLSGLFFRFFSRFLSCRFTRLHEQACLHAQRLGAHAKLGCAGLIAGDLLERRLRAQILRRFLHRVKARLHIVFLGLRFLCSMDGVHIHHKLAVLLADDLRLGLHFRAKVRNEFLLFLFGFAVCAKVKHQLAAFP